MPFENTHSNWRYEHQELLTDFYQFTMAYGYFKTGRALDKSSFQLFFRKHPFGGAYAVACGVEEAINYILNLAFGEESLDFLANLQTPAQTPYFTEDFLDFLKNLKPHCDFYAVRDGSLVFAGEPLVRIEGPLILCQLLETPLLNQLNFHTLIATKASRLVTVAQGKKIVDFGMRRAQGFDGAISAARAAFVGGVDRTSNVMASYLFGIEPSGTQAHSWIMSHKNEVEAFHSYAQALPDACVLLVDTYDTFHGVDHAIREGLELKKSGKKLLGIRLDSGDLLSLSKMARLKLDQAGLKDTEIVASGDLDEYQIEELVNEKAPIDVFGVGTRLVTAFDDPALGGVYKIAAIQNGDQSWRYCYKESDSPEKSTWPGRLSILRGLSEGQFAGDLLYDEGETLSLEQIKEQFKWETAEQALHQHLANGKRLAEKEPLTAKRERASRELSKFSPQLRALKPDQTYPLHFSKELVERRRAFHQSVTQI